jgi:DNA polymerase-3 subunit delta'
MNENAHPRLTAGLRGQEAAEHAMLDAWNGGRLAQSWLICGPRGIGKATLAFRFARFVLAGGGEGGGDGLFGPSRPESLAVAADHPVFRRVAAGGHADLKVVERGYAEDKKGGDKRRRGEIVIDDVRGIGQFMSLTAAEGGWRIVIIDAADEMNRNAANAVLKVLEEPPRRSLMLLIAHAPGRLLPTIRSRCRRITLQPLSQDVVVSLLETHLPDLGQADRRALARLSEGSVGGALDLAEQGGLELYRDAVGLLSALPKLDIPALHAFAERVAKSDDGFRTLSDLLAGWLSRMVRGGGAGFSDDIDIVSGETQAMGRLLAAADLDRWVEVWEKVTHLFARADGINLDRKQVVISAFLTVERLVKG